MSKNHIEVSELLKDEYFVKWVLQPNKESNYYWQQWITRNPSSREQVIKARQIIESLQSPENRGLTADEHDQIMGNLVNFLQVTKEQNQPRFRSFFSMSSAYAAIILLLIMVTGLGFLLYHHQSPNVAQPVAAIDKVSKTVPFGQKNTIKFIDGSEVKLNSGSEIEFLPGFEEDKRQVKLKGEAFFNIAEDKNRPFYIEVGDAMVKVIGTSFNVNSFDEAGLMKIAVVSGIVEFSTDGGDLVRLVKDEMVTYNKNDLTVQVGSFDYLHELAWKDGVLVFDKNNIHEVISKLQRWYGVEVILPDQKITGLYNGEFEDASLEFVMEGISFAYDLDYSITGKIVELK